MRRAVTGLGLGLLALSSSACWIIAGVDDLPDRGANGTGASGTGGSGAHAGGGGAHSGGGGGAGGPECTSPADCSPPGSVCTVATCEAGVCGAGQAPEGTSCEGTHVCDANGACVECVDGADCRSGACDANTCVLGVQWAKRYGGTAEDSGNGVAIDSTGNVAVVGKITKDVDFVVQTLQETDGAGDGFVLELDPDGTETLALRIGGDGAQAMTGAAFDGTHLYVGGTYTGSIDSIAATTPPSFPSAAGAMSNGALMRIDGSTVTWWREISETYVNGAFEQSINGVAAVPGFVYVAATFQDVLVDPSGVAAATPDPLTVTYSGAGTITDYAHLYGAALQKATCVAVDSTGAPVMGGSTEGDFVLAPLYTKVGLTDGWIFHDGPAPWVRGFGAAGATVEVTSVTVGPNDVVFAAGTYQTAVDLGDGNGVQAAVTGADVFLVALDPSGTVLWGKVFPATADREARVAVDDEGNLVFATTTTTAVDFGGGALPAASPVTLCLVKFDASGNHLWSGAAGGFGAMFLRGIAVSGPRLVVAGSGYGTGDLGTGPLDNPADTGGDIFVASYLLP